jgi:hypothetical protein
MRSHSVVRVFDAFASTEQFLVFVPSIFETLRRTRKVSFFIQGVFLRDYRKQFVVFLFFHIAFRIKL